MTEKNNPIIALGYIRQSQVKDTNYSHSPELQRSNIQLVSGGPAMRKKTNSIIALAYISQFQIHDTDGNDSIELQRTNIEQLCEKNGWISEWYVDEDYDKFKEKDHVSWQVLKKRLPDADVVALVVNDLSRFGISGRSTIELLGMADTYQFRILTASPREQLRY